MRQDTSTLASETDSYPRSSIVSVIGATLAPLIVFSAAIYFTRWPRSIFTTWSDYAAIAASVAIGSFFLLRLAWPPLARTLALVLYIPSLSIFLFYYCFLFVGAVFGDWL